MGKVLNSMAGLTLVLMAQPALACPPRYHAESSGSSPWNLAIPLLLFLGIPALFFKLVAPSPLPLSEERKLFPLKVWSAVLGTFLLATLAFKERRTYLHKVGELLRQKIMFEGRFSSWRTWAKDQPRAFHRVLGMSEVLAATAVVGMWTWTVMDPGQTWGTGLEIPITFTLDTVLIWVCVRSFYRRVGFHLGVASLEPGRIMRGFGCALWPLVRRADAGAHPCRQAGSAAAGAAALWLLRHAGGGGWCTGHGPEPGASVQAAATSRPYCLIESYRNSEGRGFRHGSRAPLVFQPPVSTGLPAFSQPMIPAGMMNTFL